MPDPVIFSIEIFGITIALRWYGLLIMTGVIVGSLLAAKEVERRGGNPDWVWDGLLWVVPAGVVGARLWYVVADYLGGNSRYLEEPASIIGFSKGGLSGLHIYGAFLFGAIAGFFWARHYRIDLWLVLDSVGPSLLLGQALARPANFINQELYGPPTDLPWGIKIDAAHRLPSWADLTRFPVETTRFHPTFAYEMIGNLVAGALLLWATRRYKEKMRPGSAFAWWLILAGLVRFIIEFFRPDQPRLPGTEISYTRIATVLMMLGGTLYLLIKHEILRVSFISSGSAQYRIEPSPER